MAKDKDKDKKESEIKAARSGKVGSLSIVGPIGWDYFGVSYRGFKEMLAGLKGINTLEVDITSPGGVVTDGIAIMNALVEHEATVHVYINGLAASIASVIAMAGDRIFIPSNSTMMVHKPMVFSGGNADELRKDADTLDKLEKGLVASYMRHFKGTKEEIEALLKGETWLTAEELADKFNNVTVMHQETKAVAMASIDPILGDVAHFEDETQEMTDLTEEQASLLDRFVAFLKKPKENTNQQEADMPLSQEERTEIAKEVTASVLAALKPAATETPKEPEAPKAEVIAFEGDPASKEDVAAHLAKLKQSQLEASVNWNDPKSVASYQKEVFGAPKVPESNTQSPVGVRGGPEGAEAVALDKARETVKSIRGVK